MKVAISSLVGGVLLITVGTADALFRQRFGIPVDIALILGGAGALGVHATA